MTAEQKIISGSQGAGNQSRTEDYVRDYAENYMEKVFYFCLRKTGSRAEAEDLASDISVNVLQTLSRGSLPGDFPAWVWKVARNRYSLWAARKHSRLESVSGNDIGDYEIEDESAGVEEKAVDSENLALLRRELAFIASDYRNILVAYYIEGRRTCDIAVNFGLPKGTVESKLFRARKIIKEGMDMAREFGQRSYRPEDFDFMVEGEQSYGFPGNMLAWSMMKNILLEANNSPSTLEELSIALGVALPYMEEAVEALEEVSLVAKTGNKYVTNFLIADRECRQQMHQVRSRNAGERAEWINGLVSDSLGEIRALGVQPYPGEDNLLKWWAVLYVLDFCIGQLKGYGAVWPRRPFGGNWGVVGYEKASVQEEAPVSRLVIRGRGAETYIRYRVPERNPEEQESAPKPAEDLMTCEELTFLAEVIVRNRKVSSFNDDEKIIWKRLEGRFARADQEGNVISRAFVIRKSGLNRIRELITGHPLYEKILTEMQQVFDGLVNVMGKRTNSVLKGDLGRYASMEIFHLRAMLLHDMREAGQLEIPQESEREAAGTYICLP